MTEPESLHPISHVGPDAEIARVCNHPVITQLLESVEAGIFILDERRRIVAANEAVASFAALGPGHNVLGVRPGEALGCRHSAAAPVAGCGGFRVCDNCDLLGSIRQSRRSHARVRKECTIATHCPDGSEGSLSVDVHAAPFRIGDREYTLLTLLDIRKQKHQETLQRAFFHDILNSISGLTGLCRLLETSANAADLELVRMMGATTDYLAEAVHSQRDLLAMAENRFQPHVAPVRIHVILDRLNALVATSGAAAGKRFAVARPEQDRQLMVDAVLLVRVLLNMAKNALEASPRGESVVVRCSTDGSGVRFEVTNPGGIPPEAVPRIFEKHFSTKGGTGRGIGTWGMKLIGEHYLGGTVDFVTSPSETTFYVALPEGVSDRDP